MNTFQKTVMGLAIGFAATAQAQQVIVVEGQRVVVDPSALIGEDSGSFYMSRQNATLRTSAPTADERPSAMSIALVGEDSGAAYFASLPLGPGLDRAVVVAELDQARASGELAALVSEDSGSAWLARTRAGATTAALDTGDAPSRHMAAATH